MKDIITEWQFMIRPEEYMKDIITEWQFHDKDRLWQGRCGKYTTCHQDRAIVQIYNLLGLYSRKWVKCVGKHAFYARFLTVI